MQKKTHEDLLNECYILLRDLMIDNKDTDKYIRRYYLTLLRSMAKIHKEKVKEICDNLPKNPIATSEDIKRLRWEYGKK